MRSSSDSSNEKQNHTDSSHVESPSSSTPISATGSEKSGVLAVEDYDAYINKFRRVKYTGAIWKMYKPLKDDVLYAQILQEPGDIQEVVTELLLLYNRRPEQAVCMLLKFCVDVCGFQNFEVTDHYNFQPNAAKKVIETMENSKVVAQQPCLLDTGRYLLMERATEVVQLLKTLIYNFLQKLILNAHERGILYDNFFAMHFFVFVKCMAFSSLSAIRHTGVVFAIKLLTTVVQIFSKIKDNSSSGDSSDNSQMQMQEINNYLEFFYLIFVKNCRLQDKKLTLMRVECIYEISIWVRHFPKIFITQLQTVTYLLKLITDESKDVRFAALEVCEAFVGTPDILFILKKSVPDFTEYIGKRFYDVDMKVAVKAIDIYRTLLKLDNSLITTNRFKMLMTLVFDKHFLIGEAASRFLVSYLEKTENNPEILLVQLAKFSMKPGNAVKSLLVEGCLPYCSALRNWKLYVQILLQNDIELDIKVHLAELFAEVVQQVLTGKATALRNKLRNDIIIDPDEHKKVILYFSVFSTLLEKYKDSPRILLGVLKLFTTVKDTVLDELSARSVNRICSAMENVFCYSNDNTLLKKLSDTFHYFSNTITHGNHVRQVVENISLKYKIDFDAHLISQNEEISSTILKVTVLFANFDLSKKFQWETLFDHWSDVDEVSTANYISCCKCYLIWSLKNLTAQNYKTQSPTLKRACKEFTSTCFNMIQNLKGQPLHFKTYEYLCDFYITYREVFDEMTKSVIQVRGFQLVIEDEQLQNVLISFLEKYVISSTTMSLFERRLYVVQYINLIHVGILPNKCLSNILRYYDLYEKEYGPQIEASLSDIAKRDENTMLMLVVHTLTMIYQQILDKHSIVDPTSEDGKTLKRLIKQFLNMKEFKPPQKKCVKLIYFSIKYSLKCESNYPFLYFVKYFVDLVVQNDDRIELLNFFKKAVPKKAEKNDAVLFMVNCLKNLKRGTTLDKPKPTNISKKGNQENVTPKKKKAAVVPRRRVPLSAGENSNTVKAKNTAGKERKEKDVDTETDVSDDLTIHDSESDDLEESFTALKFE